jgi:predicted nuclease of predicted toxin-antitoxin system
LRAGGKKGSVLENGYKLHLGRCLRQRGHEAASVLDVLGERTPDETIWAAAVQSGTIVITCNRDDFLALAGTQPATGLIILKRRRTRQSECNHLLRLIERAGESGLQSNINFA